MKDNEMKLSEAEIIKALECLKYGGHSCTDCKFKIRTGEERCGLKNCNIVRNALDLIKRQRDEIERLEEVISKTETTIKSEAIKEFASKLKSRIFKDIDEQGLMPLPYTKKAYDTVMIFINNLVKEMTEGDNE